MTQYKDDLGREFIDLSTLSTLLNLSVKQVRRHIRDKRLLAIKQGQTRFIAKNDILKEYPTLTPSMLERDITDKDRDITDTKGTLNSETVSQMSQMSQMSPNEQDIDLYSTNNKQDLLIKQVEQVKSVVGRLEKSLADMSYIAQDTKGIVRKLDRLTEKDSKIETDIKDIKDKLIEDGVRLEKDITDIRDTVAKRGDKRRLIGYIALGLVILGLIGIGLFGVIKFKDFYQRTRAGYENTLRTKDAQLDTLSENYNKTLLQHTQEIGEKDLAIERLRTMNEQLDKEVGGKNE